MYEEYFDRALHNPYLSKSEVCRTFGYAEGTIQHIQNEYGLLSPYRFKEQKGGGKLSPDQKLNRFLKTQETKNKTLRLKEAQDRLKSPSLTVDQRQDILNEMKSKAAELTILNQEAESSSTKKGKKAKNPPSANPPAGSNLNFMPSLARMDPRFLTLLKPESGKLFPPGMIDNLRSVEEGRQPKKAAGAPAINPYLQQINMESTDAFVTKQLEK